MAYNYPRFKKDDNSKVFMPLGSALNSFGLINQGKGITAEDLVAVIAVLYKKSVELVEKEEKRQEEKEAVKPISFPIAHPVEWKTKPDSPTYKDDLNKIDID